MPKDAPPLRLLLDQTRAELRRALDHTAQLEAELAQLRESIADTSGRDQAQIRRLMRTLAVLSDVNQGIVRIRDLPVLFQNVCQIAVEKGGYLAAWIGLLSSDDQHLIPAAYTNVPKAMLDANSAILVKDAAPLIPVFAAMRTGQHILINDLEHNQTLPPRLREELRAMGCRSGAVFPLMVKGSARGTFTLYSRDVFSFGPDEIRLLDELAGDVAFALEFAEQEDQRERYAHRLEVLHQLDLRLLHGDSVKELIEVTLQQMRQLIPSQRIRASLFDDALQQVMIYVDQTEHPTSLETGKWYPIPPGFLEAFGADTFLLIDDILARPELQRAFRYAMNEGMRSLLYVQLVAHGRKMGVLALNTAAPKFFTAEHQVIAVEIANQLAIAVYQMQINQALERHTAELETRVRERTNELQQSKDRLEAILNNSIDGILLIERDFTIRHCNDTFNHLFACHEGDYLRQPVTTLFHKIEGIPDFAAIPIPDANNQPFRHEVRAIRRDCSEFDAELILTSIQDDGFVCSIRDVTERKRTDDALKQALVQEKELGELKTRFVSMASHEFRTPLAGILTSSDTMLLYRHKMTEEDIQRRLTNIQNQVRHMTDIMEDVLQLGRMQSDQIDFHPVDVDLDALCREMIAEFSKQEGQASRIRYSGPGMPLIVPVDARLIRQSMDNLIANALKYSALEKPVRVVLAADNEHVTFQVSDEGIGIPEKDLPKLFEPFHRASNVAAVSGTGLGLSITQRAVEQHGGTITIDTQENIGSTFTIRLPIIGIDDSTIHVR